MWVKVEGANPTGSFKDRGMTVALSVAAGAGARAVVCASTGNTSASASAYAVKAGLLPIVLLPAGRIAKGKLAQAIVHGAKVVQVEGNFDECLELARKLAHDYPVTLVNSVNPVRMEGQKTAAFEVVDDLGDAPDLHVLPVGNAGNISAYWRGYTPVRAGRHGHPYAADVGLPGRRCRPAGARPSGARPRDGGHGDPDRQPGLRGPLALAARDESGGLIEAVTDAEILAAQAFLAAREGIFVEPASAAGVAGLIAQADRGAAGVRAADRGHGDRPRAQGHRHRAGRRPVRCMPRSCRPTSWRSPSVCGLVD